MVLRSIAVFLLVLGVVTVAVADERPDAAATVQLVKAGAVLIDVRSEEEWREGHVKAARLIPWQSMVATSPGLPADKNAPIVTYCAKGSRAQLAAQKLRGLGYTRAVALEGGFEDLKAAGLPTE
jgi:phage shock protein E